MNILPEPIIIYDYMDNQIGHLTPWDIQIHNGCIKQIMYIFEYKKDDNFYMSIEDPGDAHKYFFNVNKNIEQRFPNSFTRPGLMEPISLFDIEEEEVSPDSIFNKRFVTGETTENIKDFTESKLKYSITVSTEEMIRSFLHLPMQTHLIMWVRTFEIGGSI